MEPFICIQETNHYELQHFCIPEHYEKDVQSVLIPHGIVIDRVEKLAKDIVDHYQGPIVVLCVLKGGHQFFSDLISAIKRFNNRCQRSIPLALEFIRAKSYCNTSSTGKVEISGMDLATLHGKNVLVVEDIVDTGKTMTFLVAELEKFKPKSVKVASLLIKRTPAANGFTPDFIGFSIPDAFVVGYALDYNDHFRDLDHICIISTHGQEHYRVSET